MKRQLLPYTKTLPSREKSLRPKRIFTSPNESRTWKGSGFILGIIGILLLGMSVTFLVSVTLDIINS